MDKKSLLSAFLTAILIGGLILVSAMRFGTVQASTDVSGIPKPAVPEFTLKYVDYSYDVPPTYGIDPYTGKKVMTNTGGHVENRTIDVSIKNQPFTSYRDDSGNYTSLYYNIRFKGHYDDEWQTYPMDPLDGYINATRSDYTVISMPHWRIADVPAGGQVDFQVQALIGYETISTAPSPVTQGEMILHHFNGTASDWSNTQTITNSEIQTPTPSPATTPTPTPQQEPQQTEQLETIIGVAIIVAVFATGLGLLIYFIKRK